MGKIEAALRKATSWLYAWAALFLLAGCDSGLLVTPESAKRPMVTALDRLEAKSGDEVLITGKNLSSDIAVEVDKQAVELKIADNSSGSFVLPEGVNQGLMEVIFKKSGKTIAKFPLVNSEAKDTIPSLDILPLASLCDTYIFTDRNGNLVRGEAKCDAQVSACTTDGEVNCLATDAAPAALKTGLAAKILSGQTVAGVAGSAALRPVDCSADGAVDCVAVGNFPAADKGNFLDTDIRTGVSIAGVVGSLSGTPAACASDGGTACLATNLFPAIDKVNTLQANASKIRSSLSLLGVAGTLNDCSADGAVGCVSVPTYPAALVTGAAAKILSGQSLAGVAGSAAIKPADCSADGGINCVAIANFPAVNKSSLNGNVGKIRDSVTIAGVAGTLADCSFDGDAGCVALGPTYAAAIVTGAAAKILTGQTLAGVAGSAAVKPADCSTDNGTNCVATAAFPSVVKANVTEGLIKSGTTIAGVLGVYPNATYRLTGATGTADLDDTSFNAKIKAATAFEWFDSAGVHYAGAGDADLAVGNIKSTVDIFGTAGTFGALCSSDGQADCLSSASYPAALAAGAAAKILIGQTLAGIGGSAPVKPADCSTDNGTDCVAIAAFPSVIKANVTEGLIKSGTVIAGVTGAYPNATYPLAGADGTADLDSATFNAKVKAASAFEWFDSSGARYTGAGDADITAGSIKSGVDIFSSTGTFGANCTGDGQTNCLATNTYKSVDTSAISAWDIRSGKSAGGISGNVVYYKNLALLSSFNRIAGDGSNASTTVADFFDTLDDWNGGGADPIDVPPGSTAPGSNWLRDSLSDNGAGGGTAANGICDGSEDCVYKDQVSGLLWAKSDNLTYTWEAGITHCHSRNYGGYASGWRMPTQKELMQGYVDSIRLVRGSIFTTLEFYWSSTNRSDDASVAWGMWPSTGDIVRDFKTNAHYLLCVR